MAQSVLPQQQGPAGVPPEVSQEDGLHPFLRAVQENWKLVVGVIAAVLVIVSGFAVYEYMQNRSWKQASEELGDILSGTVGQERAEALRSFLGQAPSLMQPAARLELAKALDQAKKYDEAAQVWAELGQSKEASMRVLALMGRANSLRQAGHPDQAVEQLDALLASDAGSYRLPILRQLALAAEDAKQWDRAIKAYETLEAENENQEKSYIEHKLKMLRKLQG